MYFRAKVRQFSLKCKLDFAKIGFSLKIILEKRILFSKRLFYQNLELVLLATLDGLNVMHIVVEGYGMA